MATDTKTIARPYAKAAFEFALEKQSLSDWSQALAFAAFISQDAQVKSLMHNPDVSNTDVVEWMIKLIAEHAKPEQQNFLRLLAENKRLEILPEISAFYELYRAEQEKTLDVDVRSAMPLSEAQLSQLSNALQKRLQRAIRIQATTDESVIGGAVIRAGDLVIDGTIRGKLQKLNEALAA